jgi:hypothetical protein
MRAPIKALVLIALALPGVAEAAGPCPVIAALLAENPKRLKGIGPTINGEGRIDVTLGGAADAVQGAENCDLYGPAEELNINCDWSYEAGEADKAQRDFEAVKGRLEACLPTPLERQEPPVYSEQQLTEAAQRNGASFAEFLRNREVLADYEQSYPLDRYEDLELSVSVTLTRHKDEGTFRLDVDLERD